MPTVSTLTLLMLVAQRGLVLGPPEGTRTERQTQGVVKGEGERSERTISQIIWKDYRGFSQIMLSTEGETEIKRLEKGQHFSAVSHTIYLILMAACSFNLLPCVNSIKLKFTGQTPRYRPLLQQRVNFLQKIASITFFLTSPMSDI